MTLSFQDKIQPVPQSTAGDVSFASKATEVPKIFPGSPVAPDITTKADQATFPATGTESPLGIVGKTVGNMPSSAVAFGKGLFDFLNPFNRIDTAKQIGDTIGGALNEGQSGVQLAKDTLFGLPKAAIETLVPQFIQHIGAGDLQKASATLQNDPIGQILPLLFVARAGAQKAGVGAQFDQAITSVAKPVTIPAKVVGTAAKNIASGATKFGASQLTGLSPRTLEQITANPKEFSKSVQSEVTRPALAENIDTAIKNRQASLSDTGEGYKVIRSSKVPIKVDPTYLERVLNATTGLKVGGKGALETSGTASIRLPSDVNALQTKIFNVWQPEFAKGFLTPEEFLNFRSDLSKMVYNDSGIGKSTELAKLSEIVRAKVNKDFRPQIPGLEKVDNAYAPQISQLNELSKGLVDKNGNLSDMAINRIANATGKGKDPLLTRLEQLSPDITYKIKILKAVEDIQNSRENKPGTYLRAGALGAGIATLNPYLIVSAIMSLPEVAVPLLRGLGYSQSFISSLLNKLEIPQMATSINQKGGSAIIKLSPGVTAQNQKQSQLLKKK